MYPLTTPYDEIAEEYDELLRGERSVQLVETIKTARILLWKANPATRLIDLGCGPALISAAVKVDGWEVTGVDASPAMIEIASRRVTKTLHTSATATGLPDASFPVAMSTWTHGDIPWPELVREVERILEPNGFFVYVGPNPDLDPHTVSGRAFRTKMGSKDLTLGEIYEPFSHLRWRIATRVYNKAAGQIWPVFGFRAERIEG
jgi:ubiquinone/menaquinone biosynthesis C-methylase UbiE